MFFKIVVFILLSIFLRATPLYAAPLSPKIEQCVKKRATDILTPGKNEEEAYATFLRHINPYYLGARAFGGFEWKNLSEANKAYALRKYYETFMEKGSEEGVSFVQGSIEFLTLREADFPEGIPKQMIQVVISVKYLVKREFGATEERLATYAFILMRKDCTMVDVGSGGFASRYISLSSIGL